MELLWEGHIKWCKAVGVLRFLWSLSSRLEHVFEHQYSLPGSCRYTGKASLCAGEGIYTNQSGTTGAVSPRLCRFSMGTGFFYPGRENCVGQPNPEKIYSRLQNEAQIFLTDLKSFSEAIALASSTATNCEIPAITKSAFNTAEENDLRASSAKVSLKM